MYIEYICWFVCLYVFIGNILNEIYVLSCAAYMTYVHIASICSICSRLHEGCIRLVDLYGLYGWIPANFGTVGTTTPMFHILNLFPNCQRPSQTHTKPVASAKVTAQMLAGKDHEIPSSVRWNALLQGILWLSDYLMSCSCPLKNLIHLGPTGAMKRTSIPESSHIWKGVETNEKAHPKINRTWGCS